MIHLKELKISSGSFQYKSLRFQFEQLEYVTDPVYKLKVNGIRVLDYFTYESLVSAIDCLCQTEQNLRDSYLTIPAIHANYLADVSWVNYKYLMAVKKYNIEKHDIELKRLKDQVII